LNFILFFKHDNVIMHDAFMQNSSKSDCIVAQCTFHFVMHQCDYYKQESNDRQLKRRNLH
jgi:hypothetical protein